MAERYKQPVFCARLGAARVLYICLVITDVAEQYCLSCRKLAYDGACVIVRGTGSKGTRAGMITENEVLT